MSSESDGVDTSVKPAKKKHTGENALRRFFPDNFSALHRTQGVLYAFQNAEEAKQVGLASIELIKLKRSVLQWATIPPVIMKGLSSLPDNFTAVGCCAADAVLNRVDPHRAFVVVRTPESGKGQWNIIALYNPPNTVISERRKLNIQVADVFKNEQATKKLAPHKVKAKETTQGSSLYNVSGAVKPKKEPKLPHQKMKRPQELINVRPLKIPSYSSSAPVLPMPQIQGSPSTAFLLSSSADTPPVKPTLSLALQQGYPVSSSSSPSPMLLDNSGSGSRGVDGSHGANSGVGSLDSMMDGNVGFGDGMAEPSVPKLTVSSAPPLQREYNPFFDPLHQRLSPPLLVAHQHIEVPTPSPMLLMESPPRSLFTLESPGKSTSPPLFGNTSPGGGFMAPVPPMTDTFPLGMTDMTSGSLGATSSPGVRTISTGATPLPQSTPLRPAPGTPLQTPGFLGTPLGGRMTPSPPQTFSPLSSHYNPGLDFWASPLLPNSPQLRQQRTLLNKTSSPSSPGSPALGIDGVDGSRRKRPMTPLASGLVPTSTTFSAPSSPTRQASPRLPQTLFERYRTMAENCWTMRFGEADSAPWSEFRTFVNMDKLCPENGPLDQLSEFFCERSDSTAVPRIRWVIFVLLFHRQLWEDDPRPYLALQEAVQCMQTEAFHGVQVRSVADSLLRNSVQNKACYLFRTSDTSCGYIVLSRKHTSIRGDSFLHTLYGHHRPGENVVLSTVGGKLGSYMEVALDAAHEIAADFFYDPANPLGSRFQTLRAIVEAKSAQEGFQYVPVMHGSGYLSDSDASSSTSDVI